MNIDRSYTLEDVLAKLDGHNATDASSLDPDKDAWAMASFKEAYSLLQTGWDVPVTKMDTEALAGIRDVMRPVMLWDVAGSEVDVGAAMTGLPEAMGEMVRRKRPQPVVRIGLDLSVSAGVTPDKYELLGRSVLTVVESLRLAGFPAEIWATEAVGPGMAARGRTGRYNLRVLIQEAGRPLDVSRLAFWVAHPAALRRILFGLEETEDFSIRKHFGFLQSGGGYGHVVRAGMKKEFDEFAPSAQNSEAAITRWINDVLTRRGIKH